MKKHYMYRSIKIYLTLAVIWIVGGFTMSACSSSEKNAVSNGNTATGAAQNAAENSQPNTAEKPKPEKPSDIFAAFKKGNDYKTAIRPQILKDGWQPARSEDGNENCVSGMKICEEYPELNAGPAARLGNIVFRWKKGDKVLLIFTLDDPPIYERYEFEKSSKQSIEPDILGKYECCEIGISGERTLEFKAKNLVIFNERDEGSTATGSGSWNWDANREFINVNLTVKQEFEDGVNVETKTAKVSFQLKKDGMDLKIVKETLSTSNLSGFYIGKTFKKK